MSLVHDSMFLAFGGEPVAGRAPPVTRTMGQGLTDVQRSMAQVAFAQFKNDVRLSIAPSMQRYVTLADGSVLKLESSFGIDRLTVVSMPAQRVVKAVEELDYFVYDTFKGEGLLADHRGEIGATWSGATAGVLAGGFLTNPLDEGYSESTASGTIGTDEAYMEIIVEDVFPDSAFTIFMTTSALAGGAYTEVHYGEESSNDPDSRFAELAVEHAPGEFGDPANWKAIASMASWTPSAESETIGYPPLPAAFGQQRTIRVEARAAATTLLIDGVQIAVVPHPSGTPSLKGGKFYLGSGGAAAQPKIYDVKVGRLKP